MEKTVYSGFAINWVDRVHQEERTVGYGSL